MKILDHILPYGGWMICVACLTLNACKSTPPSQPAPSPETRRMANELNELSASGGFFYYDGEMFDRARVRNGELQIMSANWPWTTINLANARFTDASGKDLMARPVTEQPREYWTYYYTNAFGDLFLGTGYFKPLTRTQFYTNKQDDALIEANIAGPPVLPGKARIPVFTNAPAASNWMTAPKAMQPKFIGTNLPGTVLLSRLTMTAPSGKKFVAELTVSTNITVQADENFAVVIFPLPTRDVTIDVNTNLLFKNWQVIASGTTVNQTALVWIDSHFGERPQQFFRQITTP